MTFAKLSSYFQKLESTASRNKMTEVLAQLFKEANQKEIDKICYLSLGQLGPKFATIQFALAEKMMIKIVAQATAKTEEEIRKRFKETGDLGEVVYQLKKKTKGAKLSVAEAYQRLYQIASESGMGSVERKIQKTAQLIHELDPLSAKYIVRIPLSRLRLGFSDMTILDALSWMISGDKSKRKEIERAYHLRADVGQIAQIVKAKGLKGLKNLKVSLGTPIMPALCQRLPTAEEMIEKMAEVAVEPKFDGQRMQIHFSQEKTVVFTRNLDNVTHMFPDIIAALTKAVKAKQVILDGEAIGFNPKTGKFLPFQETIKRKRKYGVRKMAQEIPLKFFSFDVLYHDGQDLLKRPFKERRQILEKILKPGNQTIVLAPQIVTRDPEVVRRFHDQQIEKGLEGAVLKKWQATYDPGRRGYTWVKFKAEKNGKRGGGLADTVDCVVMGYYRGKGKRTGFGIGAFLVGVRQGSKFLTVSKIGTGLSDDQWLEMRQRADKAKVKEEPKEYQLTKELIPDVWCQPELVVEIEADNITRSPLHTAGLALRFPRLLRFRDDKSVAQATSLQELKKLYKMQK